VIKDLGEDAGIGDKSDDDHGRGALRAGQHVDIEDAAHERRPNQTTWTFRRWIVVLPVIRGVLVALFVWQHLLVILDRWWRWQTVPKAGAVGEDPIIAHEIRVRGRNERGQSAHERDRVEDDLGSPVEPWLAELIMDLPVRIYGEALQGER